MFLVILYQSPNTSCGKLSHQEGVECLEAAAPAVPPLEGVVHAEGEEGDEGDKHEDDPE